MLVAVPTLKQPRTSALTYLILEDTIGLSMLIPVPTLKQPRTCALTYLILEDTIGLSILVAVPTLKQLCTSALTYLILEDTIGLSMLVAVPTLKQVCAWAVGTDIPDPGGHNRVEHVGCCAHPETAVEGVAGAPAAGLSAPQICTVQHHHYRDTVTRFYCPIF